MLIVGALIVAAGIGFLIYWFLPLLMAIGLNLVLAALAIWFMVSWAPVIGSNLARSSAPTPPEAAQPTSATPQPGAPVPTARPAAPTANGQCVAKSEVLDRFANAKGPGDRIQVLNEIFDDHGGNVGEGWINTPFDLRNPGPGGISLFWTDLLGKSPEILTSGQTLDNNFFGVTRQGGWGVFAAYTAMRIPTPGRSLRLCESATVEELQR